MKKLFKIPSVLRVATLSLGALSCSSTPSPTDAAREDRVGEIQPMDVSPVDVATQDLTPLDACPDPFLCYSSLEPDGDGGANLVYIRRDGGTSDVACPPVPPMCPMA